MRCSKVLVSALCAFGLVAAVAMAEEKAAATCDAKACPMQKTAADAKAKAQDTCPVMAGKVDKKFFADYEGKRVYFCCAGCIATFQKDPAKYVKEMESKGITLDKTPAAPAAAPAAK